MNLTATASSSLPVSYAITSGPATVSGATLTISGAGSVVVAANQTGNSTYQAAPTVSQNITISDGQGPPQQLAANKDDSGKCGIGGLFSLLSFAFVLSLRPLGNRCCSR